MQDHSWDKLLPTLKIRGAVRPLPERMVDDFEQEGRLTLPSSYRSWCRLLGPGYLAKFFFIAVPGYTGEYKDRYDVRALNKFVHSEACVGKLYVDNPEQFERFVVFATDSLASLYCWDPAVQTDPACHEYAIFVVYRDWEVKRVCDTFFQFVHICLYDEDNRLYEDSEPREREFSTADQP